MPDPQTIAAAGFVLIATAAGTILYAGALLAAAAISRHRRRQGRP